MTLALILTALWLAIMLLVVVACRMAAKGDRGMQPDRLAQLSDELSASGEPPVAMPQFKAYRLRNRSATLQSTAPEHMRHRPQ
jgi:HAMP domain-containing protein